MIANLTSVALAGMGNGAVPAAALDLVQRAKARGDYEPVWDESQFWARLGQGYRPGPSGK